jgi:hypothetical protein
MTTRSPQQHRIDRSLINLMRNLGDNLLPDAALRTEIELCTHPRPTTSEVDDAIRHADINKRITGVRTETGVKWKLSDTGRAWAAENL